MEYGLRRIVYGVCNATISGESKTDVVDTSFSCVFLSRMAIRLRWSLRSSVLHRFFIVYFRWRSVFFDLERETEKERERKTIEGSDGRRTNEKEISDRQIFLLRRSFIFLSEGKSSSADCFRRFRFLYSRLRTTPLRNDFEGTAVLINLLLRNYLHYNLYSQAQKLVLKSVFPDHASNNEWTRYLYYLGAFRQPQSNCIVFSSSGRIRGIQLEYTKAHQHLLTAIRKAPQQTAIGFRQNVRLEIDFSSSIYFV